MRKLTVLFSVLLFAFAVQAQAAELHWVDKSTPGALSTIQTDVSHQNLTGSADFLGVSEVNRVHTWTFGLNAASHVQNFVLEFFDNQMKINSVTVDGMLMSQEKLGSGKTAIRQWSLATLLGAGNHTISLAIDEVMSTGAQYDVKVSTVVPVPAAVWLFGSALLGLTGFARRKSA